MGWDGICGEAHIKDEDESYCLFEMDSLSLMHTCVRKALRRRSNFESFLMHWEEGPKMYKDIVMHLRFFVMCYNNGACILFGHIAFRRCTLYESFVLQVLGSIVISRIYIYIFKGICWLLEKLVNCISMIIKWTN